MNTMLGAALGTILLAASVSVGGADPYAGWAVGNRTNGYGTVMRTMDGGTNWTRQGAQQIADINLYGVTAVDASTAWTVGDPDGGYASIYRTTDGGTNCMRKGSLTNIPHTELTDANSAWTVGGNPDGGYVVLHTGDGGSNWTEMCRFGLGDANEVSAVNASAVWVACDSQILRSTDGGHFWEAPSSPPYTMGISAVSSAEAWAVVSGESSETGSILHTSDGGATWAAQLSGETLAPLWSISIANPPLRPLLSIFPLTTADGVLVIQLTAPSNYVCELQAASDCVSANWQPIGVATNLTGTEFYTNSQADCVNQQFYRARVVR